jgi:hypothetical protein
VKKTLRDLFTSKKFLATLGGLAVQGASSAGWLSSDSAHWAMGMLAAYVAGQGLADLGKEAAKQKSLPDAFGATEVKR